MKKLFGLIFKFLSVRLSLSFINLQIRHSIKNLIPFLDKVNHAVLSLTIILLTIIDALLTDKIASLIIAITLLYFTWFKKKFDLWLSTKSTAS